MGATLGTPEGGLGSSALQDKRSAGVREGRRGERRFNRFPASFPSTPLLSTISKCEEDIDSRMDQMRDTYRSEIAEMSARAVSKGRWSTGRRVDVLLGSGLHSR